MRVIATRSLSQEHPGDGLSYTFSMHQHFIFKFSKFYKIALNTAIFFAVGGASVSASDTALLLSQEIKSFNDGNYNQTVSIGKEIEAQEPANATACYYCGQALAKLNRSGEAIAQFSQCYKMTKDPRMKSYSLIALQNLSRNSNAKAPSSAEVGDSLQTIKQADNSNQAQSQGAELSSLKLKIFEEGAREIKLHREQADRDIQSAKNRALEQMQGIPQFLNRRYFVNGQNTGMYPNPEYPDAFEKSQAELANTMAQINATFTRRESEIMAECKRRASGYDQVGVGMKSQETPGTSNIQLTPRHTNTYLRQYVNYDGAVPGALKARTGSLLNNSQNSKTLVPKAAK